MYCKVCGSSKDGAASMHRCGKTFWLYTHRAQAIEGEEQNHIYSQNLSII